MHKKSHMSTKEIDKALQEFLQAFEDVFDEDWQYTKEMLCINDETEEQKATALELGLEAIEIISERGTFLKPGVDDETEDWGARGNLLSKYRELKKLLNDKQ